MSRNKALHHGINPNGDSELRKKMLTQSDDKYNSHKRGSSKIIGSDMMKSPNASPQFEPLKIKMEPARSLHDGFMAPSAGQKL